MKYILIIFYFLITFQAYNFEYTRTISGKRTIITSFDITEEEKFVNFVLDGTFTMTNIGIFESLTGTAILNQPQLGIIAFGSVRKMPRVIETNKGDFIGIRKVIMISLSFDHRIINGATGGLFLKRIKNLIQEWDINQEV